MLWLAVDEPVPETAWPAELYTVWVPLPGDVKGAGGGTIKGEIQIHDDDMPLKEPSERIWQAVRTQDPWDPALVNQCREMYAGYMRKVTGAL